MCAYVLVCRGEHFMEGGYFSVSHRKVLWVNVEGGGHSEYGVHPCATVHVMHMCVVACWVYNACHRGWLWRPQKRVTVGVGVGDTCYTCPFQRKHMCVLRDVV